MGVLAKIGSGITNAISKAAVLSPKQLDEIAKKKQEYIKQMPDPNSDESIDLIEKILGACAVEIHSAYLPQISTLYSPLNANAEFDKDFDVEHNIRYFNITKWVTDKKENSLEKLVTVYETLSNENCNIALIFDRKMETTNVYLAIVNLDNSDTNTTIDKYRDRLISSIKGNFPGTECKNDGKGIIPCLDTERDFNIASVSNLPTEKSEKFISQTIEKLIDGIIPQKKEEEYIMVLLATPVADIETRKLRLSEYYSGLAPYSTWQTRFDTNEATTNISTFNLGANVGANVGVNVGQSTSFGTTDGKSHSITDGTSKSLTSGTSHSVANGTSDSVTTPNGILGKAGTAVGTVGGAATAIGSTLGIISAGAAASATGIGAVVGVPLMIAGGLALAGGGIASILAGSRTAGTSNTITDSVNNSETNTTSHSETDTESHSTTNTQGQNRGNFAGLNFGINFARSSSASAMVGKTEGISQTYINYTIKHTLEVLEEQMKRLEQSTALGMWDFAAYFLSESSTIANNVAHSYLSLTQGEKSFLSNSAINLWRGDIIDKKGTTKEIFKYIKELRHPIFALNPNILDEEPSFNIYPTIVTATTSLSSKELSYSLNFPRKSIAGFPVFECAEFGRNISTYDTIKDDVKFKIGNVFHMNHIEPTPIELSKNSLASHTFITGSTGSGKSNTVYKILDEANKNGVKFLVVEPTKGEYKNVFASGDDPIAKVYGTNQYLSPLLHLNPFKFPKEIHVFEHMDRLIEIFNVCWPMYAAMPAVLKNAIQKSYEDCGWDIVSSKNNYGDDLYPSFKDVARNIKSIIDSSEYDTENKGAYKGSLLTRLESLTNGINSLIFTNDEIPLNELFDENVIIDISRVGSSEAKSLIMGMIVLKLQEYRIANHSEMNEKLKHITVLEEAHNILKRTTTEQPVEGGNLIGKSVEMISNAIAEMRTYGEGFIIVDQAPGLLDMSAIRNTNTKIIMRLPDEEDRKLVGKASNLNDDQITELAKLPCGVGAVYQNEWIEPVLCKVDKFEEANDKYQYDYLEKANDNNIQDALVISNYLIRNEKLNENELREIKECLNKVKISSSSKILVITLLKNIPNELLATKLAPIMSELYPSAYEIVKKAYYMGDEMLWTRMTDDALQEVLRNEAIDVHFRKTVVQSLITQYLYNELNKSDRLERWSEIGGLNSEIR